MTAGDPFAALAGQDEAAALLRRAVASGRVAHAYAFVGPPGAGRRPAALALAAALNAADPTAAGRIARGAHPDVRVIAPVPHPDRPKGPVAIRIEQIRELERLAALRAAGDAWKVFVIDDAERMTGATPQAFLKTLEEPPPRTVIVLVLTRLRGLPATVLSRCQVVRFRPRSEAGAVALLPDAGGAARSQALALLDEARRRGPAGILRAGEAVGRDRAPAEALVETGWLWYRDLVCAGAGAPRARLVFGDAAAAAAREVTAGQALAGFEACREAWHAIQGNVTPRLTVEVLLGRLAGLAA